MREIKFRAKSIQDFETSADGVQKGDWVYGYYYFCRARETGIIVTELEAESGGVGSGIVQVEIEVDGKTKCQFTGLKDKNGKEIYEGDVLLQKTTEHFKQFNSSVWERRYQVKFGENDWRDSHAGHNTICFYLESISSYTTRIGINQYDLLDANYPFEIIGNIYENPELIK